MAMNFKMPSKKSTIIVLIVILAIIAITGTVVFLKDRGSAEVAGTENTESSRQEENVSENNETARNNNNQNNEQAGEVDENQNPVENQENEIITTDNNAGNVDTTTNNNENENANANVNGNANAGTTVDNIQETTITRTEEVEIPERQISEGHYVGWTPMDVNAEIASANITATPDEVEVTKTGDETVKQGDEVTYVITVTNKGNTDLEQIEVKDRLDGSILDLTSVEFLTVTDENEEENLWTESGILNENVVVWEVDIAKGQTITIKFKATVKTSVEEGTILKNSVVANGVEVEKPAETEIEEAKISVPVTKTWENMESDAAEDHKLNSIKVTLDGTDKELILNDGNSWADKFTDLPKYDVDGTEIIYTVTESGVTPEDQAILDKYYKQEENVEGQFVNTFDLSKVDDKTEVPVAKKWENMTSDAAEDHKLNSIKVTLDGTDKELILNDGNSWADKFTDLPKYDVDGKEITYTVTESGVTPEDQAILDKYYKQEENVEGQFVNTFDLSKVDDKTEVPVAKKWENMTSDAAEDHKLNSIKVTLDGTDKELILNDGNSWADKFTDLPKYDVNGTEIIYTVTESGVTPEDQAILDKYYKQEENVEGQFVNTFDLSKVDDKTEVPVAKKWENMTSDAAEDHKLNSIKVTLDGTDKELILNDGNSWADKFTDLPKYDVDGKEITYTVTESGVTPEDQAILDKYYKQEENVEGQFVNTFDLSKVDDKKEITVIKRWIGDQDVSESTRPSELTINVENDKNSEIESVKITKNTDIDTDANTWTIKKEVNKYDENGNEITYQYGNEESSETKFKNYIEGNNSSENDVITVENEYKVPNIPTNEITKEGTDEITSKDDEISYEVKYTSVVENYIGKATVTIVDELPYEIDLEKSELNGGEYKVEKGKATITWTENVNVTENSQTIEITKSIKVVYVGMNLTEGENIVNKVKGIIDLDEDGKDPYEPVEDEKETEKDFDKTITVIKSWLGDEEVKEETRPSNLTVTVKNQANANITEDVILIKSEGNDWQGTVLVNKYNADGTDAKYEFKEEISTETGKFAKYEMVNASVNEAGNVIIVENEYKVPNITVAKIQNREQNEVVKYGDLITYTITATNTGNATGSVNIKDVIDIDAELVGSITVTPSSLGPITKAQLESAEGYELTLGKAGTETAEATIQFTVKATGYAGNEIVNVANYKKDGETEFTPTEPPCVVKIEDDTQVIPTTTETTTVTVPQKAILVLDFSASMDSSKIDALKTAVDTFLKNFLTGNNEVMIMTYNSSVTVRQEWTTNATTAYNSIKNLTKTATGTNIDAALTEANEYIKDTNTSVILMTDGWPCGYVDDKTKKNIASGNGTSYDEKSATEALKAAQALPKANRVFTVGLKLANDYRVKDLMEGMASKPEYYFPAANDEALKKAFENISTSITTTTDGDAIPLETIDGIVTITEGVEINQNVEIYTGNYENADVSNLYKSYSWNEFLGLTYEEDGETKKYAEYKNGVLTFNLGKYMENEKIVANELLTIRFVKPSTPTQNTRLNTKNAKSLEVNEELTLSATLSSLRSKVEENEINEENYSSIEEKLIAKDNEIDKVSKPAEVIDEETTTEVENTVDDNIVIDDKNDANISEEKDEITDITNVEETKTDDVDDIEEDVVEEPIEVDLKETIVDLKPND